MKNLIILFLFSGVIIYSQQSSVKGRITDFDNGNPLPNAHILAPDGSGTISDLRGNFNLTNVTAGTEIKISYVGYESRRIIIDDPASFLNVRLKQTILTSQSVLVQGSMGRKGITPLVLEQLGREEIEQSYSVQDIPQFLSTQPSVISYSESGSGIGYNYLSIRGFDQRRIAVSINGIPQNDPEDHNVYWLDFPDILGSTEMIQVQRGAGSGVFGYPAIGGSINIITSSFTNSPGMKLESYTGSYNTRKYSASFNSGLISDQYSVSAKLSRINSSGYRDLSWAKFNAYHLSAVRYDDNITTQINLYGGPIEDGLAYIGVAKFAVKDRDLRKANYSYWEADPETNEYTYTLLRRPDEIENFSQPHYELLNEIKLSDNLNLNSALFLVTGSGFFDYDGSWADTSYLRLTSEYGFSPAGNPGNTLIRAQVENQQFGWIPRLSLNHTNGELIFGGELRIHRSDHWGSIIYGENLPGNLTRDHRYYFYNGSKDIVSTFIQESYRPSEKINLLGEVQFAYNKYRLNNERFVGNDFSVGHFFINPRAGINYKLTDNQSVFLSFARISREPRLKNYYDAAESSGGEEPLFERNNEGLFDFNNPLVKPETMNDIEFGTLFTSSNFTVSMNLFYMSFENEIIKNGKIDRFGQPVTGNADRTIHQGVELSTSIRLPLGFELWGNATYSKNVIKEARFFLTENDFIDLKDNRISGFPDVMANFGLTFSRYGIRTQFTGRYVGAFYSDNYDQRLPEYLNLFPGFVAYSDNRNDPYFTADFLGSYELNLFNPVIPSKLYIRVINLFDRLYSAYAIGQEFFPAAERNFIAGIQIGL
jgi:iron complex outermembrane recepter protein